MARKRATTEPASTAMDEPVRDTRKPLVFISHDTRDADIAEAFTNLLTDASGGILQSFRSSDRKGVSGIEFGAEWYRTIMERIENATDVVALLTDYSINRPWILYEAGVAKGKLDRVVFGLALGIPLTETNIGPFAQFQNSGDDEDSLTKLVLQLIRRNPDAVPREEAVRRQVIAFMDIVTQLLKTREETPASVSLTENDTEDVAKLFEEVKVMFRELPDRLEGTMKSQVNRAGVTSRGRVHPSLMMDAVFSATSLEPRDRIAIWLVATAPLRDDFPWLYDTLLEASRAVNSRNARAVKQLAHTLTRMVYSPAVELILAESIDRDKASSVLGLLFQMPDLLTQLSTDMPPARSYANALARLQAESTEKE